MKLFNSSTYQNNLSITAKQIVNRERLINSSVLITGASGMIGSYLIDTLLYLNNHENMNIKIFAVGRNLEKLTDRFPEYYSKNSIVFIKQDINNKINFNVECDYIIHAASNAYPATFNNYPVDTMKNNLVGTLNLLDYSISHNVKKFLFVSTGEVYGKLTMDNVPFIEEVLGELDTMSVRSCYPMSKRAAETLCVSFSKQYDLDVVIVRPSHIFGPNFTENDNRANVQFFRNVLAGDDILLKSMGSQYRTYCYVGDCVSGILSVLIGGKSASVYNITNSKNDITLLQFAAEIANAANRNVKIDLPHNVDRSNQTPIDIAVLDDKKLRGLGWKPVFSLVKSINETFLILKEVASKQ